MTIKPTPDDAVSRSATVEESLARLRPQGARQFPLEAEEARLERMEVEAAAQHARQPASSIQVLVPDTWGDPTPAERLVEPEADACPLSLRAQIARALAPEAWKAADASLRQADAVLGVIEGRKTP